MVVGEPGSGDLSVLVEPRLLTEDDIPFCFYLSERRYEARFDRITTEGWFRNIVLKQPLMFLPQRMDNSFCISSLSVAPWLSAEVECNMVFIVAEDGAMWEAMKLLRASIAWARYRRCTTWRMSSDTDVKLDMMARRLGCKELSPRFTLRL